MLPEEKIARRFSEMRGLKPPVNVEALVQEFATLEEDFLPADYDAVFLDKSAKHPRPRVIITVGQPPTRRAFTLAHELGHIVIPWHNGTHFCRVGAEARLVDRLVKEVESQANRFAAELLMPKVWVENLLKIHKPIKELVDAVSIANVSYLAASIRLVQMLPEGYAFVEIDSDDIIRRVQSTDGTLIKLPGESELLVKERMDRLADDSAIFKSGHSKIIWWHFINKLNAPKTQAIQGNATDLLQQIVEELFPNKAEAKNQIMSINGVIGAANGAYQREKKGDLFTILKHRFANRTELAEIIEHPSFEFFLQKRIEEIEAREDGRAS
jgi:Zn-dependent peptidase ImmA (M78 family)